MKLRILVITALLTSLGLALPGDAASVLGSAPATKSVLLAQSGWQPFTSNAGKFKVEMPGTPKEGSESDELDGEPITLHQFGFNAEDDSGGYIVLYTDLPNSYIKQGSEKILDEMSAELLASIGAQELASGGQEISLNGNPGREFRQKGEEGVFVLRLYLVDKRFYVLLTQSQEGNVNKFLDSFKLL